MIMKLLIIVTLFATITSTSPIFKRDLSSNNSSTSYSLDDLCSISHVRESLPLNGTLLGIEMIPTSVEVNVAESSNYSYCNISVSYAHTGKNDTVVLNYALPDPSNFENRFYVAGGGGYSLSSSSTSSLSYGAAGGALMLVTMPSIHHMTRWFFLAMVLSTGMQLTCSLTKDWVK